MSIPALDDILASVANGTARDQDLLQIARAVSADDLLRHFREHWPTERLPIISDYYCVARLGQGTSGIVFKALVIRPQPMLVALKVLPFASRDLALRFREREIEILKALDCPHVARYLESGVAGGSIYLVMELVRGVSLDEYLSTRPDLGTRLQIFQRVCAAVAAVHAAGVVHRDLKPKHILVDDDGEPWIVDFGLSTVQTEDWPTRVRRAQTELGRIMGTVKYMAPEQAWGGLMGGDQRTDIWALGVMLYEIATDGDYPFSLEGIDGSSGHDALVHRIQTETPRKPRIAAGELREPLEILISRCLTHELSRRLDSAATLAADLNLCLNHQHIRTRRLPLWQRGQRILVGLAVRRRSSLWLSAVTAAIVSIMTLIVVAGGRWSPIRRSEVHLPAAMSSHGTIADRGIVILGLQDESSDVVPGLAGQLGIPGITPHYGTWRPVDGHLMKRLAAIQPRMVLFDFCFMTQGPGEPEFIAGVRALHDAGTAVVLGACDYRPDGTPNLSPTLYEPMRDIVHHGLVSAEVHKVTADWDFLLSLKRGDRLIPGIVLAGFAHGLYPRSSVTLDWDLSKTLRLYFSDPTSGGPRVVRVPLSKARPGLGSSAARLRAGDLLGWAAIGLHPDGPQHWEQRTMPYHGALVADDAMLHHWFHNKLVIVGDLRTAGSLARVDRHTARYGGQIIQNVPGSYLLADAVAGLMDGTVQQAAVPPGALLLIALTSLAACLIAPRLTAQPWLTTPARRYAALGGTLLVALVCVAGLVVTRTQILAYAAMGGTAVCLSLAASLAIEYARNHYRIPLPPR